jgi:hypothetical protein
MADIRECFDADLQFFLPGAVFLFYDHNSLRILLNQSTTGKKEFQHCEIDQGINLIHIFDVKLISKYFNLTQFISHV